MSDIASQFYDAFALVNEVSPIQLICTWHVEKAWREELRQKVSSIEIQSEVYRYLGTVAEQTDRNVFEDYLSEFLIRLQMSSSTSSAKNNGRSAVIDRRKSFCDRQKALFKGHNDRHYLDIVTTFINFTSFANSSKTSFAII